MLLAFLLALSRSTTSLKAETERDAAQRVQGAKAAAAARIREFRGLVAEIRAQIAASDDPGFWVNFFADNAAPSLMSAFDQVVDDLPNRDITKARIDDVLRLARLDRGEIYANKQQVLDSIESLKNDT